MNLINLSFYCYLVSFFLILIFFFIDRRKKRKLKYQADISILIPCYNNGESIELAIKSIYNSYPTQHFQLIVINDKSTDDSLEKLQKLQNIYHFTLIENEKNL
jgi:GT2 family glycosyltransferase